MLDQNLKTFISILNERENWGFKLDPQRLERAIALSSLILKEPEKCRHLDIGQWALFLANLDTSRCITCMSALKESIPGFWDTVLTKLANDDEAVIAAKSVINERLNVLVRHEIFKTYPSDTLSAVNQVAKIILGAGNGDH